jgi:pimeloyl-ACP methyl ester carboxylesterase
VYFQIPVLITIASLFIIPSGAILTNTNNNFGITTNFAYGQTNQTNSNNTNLLNIQSIPVKKVHVGDIDIAYRTFGKGDPILLIGGVGDKMNSWEPSILKNLSTNHTVIIFDNRGVGNTTTGTKPFSIQQLANDTTGLLDALKIQKADILGYSLGSFVAQQLAVTHPEKVNRLVLVAASCGGKESISLSPQVLKIGSEVIKNATNNLPISVRMLMNLTMGPELKSHPNLLQSIPEHLYYSQFYPIPLNSYKEYYRMSTNWSGVCDKLTKVSSPTLIITGTADKNVLPGNSLIIAAKIPDAWLVHIKDATHALMSQYPDKFNQVLQTFLSTTTNSG